MRYASISSDTESRRRLVEQDRPEIRRELRCALGVELGPAVAQCQEHLTVHRGGPHADAGRHGGRRREPQLGGRTRPGPEVEGLKKELEAFLHRRVYRHYRVMRMAAKGRRVLHALFVEFGRSPDLLPERYGRRARVSGQLERTVCDYLAGMTDRYAQDEYLRLFQPDVSV